MEEKKKRHFKIVTPCMTQFVCMVSDVYIQILSCSKYQWDFWKRPKIVGRSLACIGGLVVCHIHSNSNNGFKYYTCFLRWPFVSHVQPWFSLVQSRTLRVADRLVFWRLSPRVPSIDPVLSSHHHVLPPTHVDALLIVSAGRKNVCLLFTGLQKKRCTPV